MYYVLLVTADQYALLLDALADLADTTKSSEEEQLADDLYDELLLQMYNNCPQC